MASDPHLGLGTVPTPDAPDELFAVLQAQGFQPEDVKPQLFDFKRKADEKATENKGVDSQEGEPRPSGKASARPPSLPQRLQLHLFSRTVGWRPAGVHAGQTRLFVDRFPTEFRLAAVQRIVMPHNDGLPYVTPEGLLPCPWLSTCNALKVPPGVSSEICGLCGV